MYRDALVVRDVSPRNLVVSRVLKNRTFVVYSNFSLFGNVVIGMLSRDSFC